MAHFIQTSDNGPELVESQFKTLLVPAAYFQAVLTQGAATEVDLVGDDGVVYGSFTLDTIDQQVRSSLVTPLPKRLKFVVTSGTGKFRIAIYPGV